MTAGKTKKKAPSDFRWFVGSIFTLTKRFGSQVIWAACLGYVAHETALVLTALAGRTSNANLALRIFGNLNLAVSISFTVAGLSIGLYLYERKLHRTSRERLAKRITSLELTIDKNRTSSRLTSEGLTQREDL
jgi:hypothetical protein